MAGVYNLLILVLISLASAFPQPSLDLRQASTTDAASCSTDVPASALSVCISGGGRAAITSVCRSLTSTAIVYETVKVPSTTTRTTTVGTSFSSTVTRVSSRSTTTVTTTTYTSTVRVTSGTTSSLAGVVTTGVLSTSFQYTCPNSARPTPFPTSTPPDDSAGIVRRQVNACLPVLRRKYGDDGIIDACRCLRPTSSIATVTATLTITAFSGVVSVTESRTATLRTTRTTTTTTFTATSVVSSGIATSTTIPVTIPFTSTVTTTDVTTVTTAYPLPTGRFRIFMNINGQRLYGRNIEAASNDNGTDVIALVPGRNGAASFGFNNLLNLILSGTQTKIAVEQQTWAVPFVYLVPNGLPLDDPWTAPTFAPCDATLVATGAQSNYIFAACFGGNEPNRLLAFGSRGVWSVSGNGDGDAAEAIQNGTCIAGAVGIEAVSGSLTPTPSSPSSPAETTTSTDDTSTPLSIDSTTTESVTGTDQESTSTPTSTDDATSPGMTFPPEPTTSSTDSSTTDDVSSTTSEITTSDDGTLPSVTESSTEGSIETPPASPPLARAPEGYWT
ncbi:hypothetical protein CKM354_000615100 [Cercospora kikuchii]|uniref:Uncharacterized protein n=1 Tax=Cercospora kikuchii TaxID=84275 RepID=A0A9P3FD46_9PEZI|nr:uncharacterized protein CKM354_000615100 [Cercospora kikuchii]GIZ42903.1 hypothetical protein CKM354_000615100 [Cercospora kikuchii]